MILEGIVGVVTGLVGNVVTSITNYKTQKLKNIHDKDMAILAKEAMLAKADVGIKVEDAKAKGELTKIEEVNYGKVLTRGNTKGLTSATIRRLFDSKWTAWLGSILVMVLGLTEALKGLMRPVLTLYLVGLTSWLTYYASNVLGAKQALLGVTEAASLFSRITDIVIYLTVSVVTWWFADRRVAKFLYRLEDGNIKE